MGGKCWGSPLLRYRLLLSPCSASMPHSSSRSLAIESRSNPSRSMRRSYSCTGRVASALVSGDVQDSSCSMCAATFALAAATYE